MQSKRFLAGFLAAALAAPALWAAGTMLPSGKYTAQLTPAVNEKSADTIEKQLDQIQEINAIDVKPKDSTLHFTVKDNAQVDWARITNAVKAAAPTTAVGQPMQEAASSSATGTGATGTPPRSGY